MRAVLRNEAHRTCGVGLALAFSLAACGPAGVQSTREREAAPQQATTAPEPVDASQNTPHIIDHSRSHVGEYPHEQMPPIETPSPAPPVAPPEANERGCVEAHQTYASALEAERDRLRNVALSSVDADWVERAGFFIEDDVSKMLDKSYQVDGVTFAVVGFGARRGRDARVRIAKRGNTLHRVIDNGQYVPVTVPACGANPCQRGSGVRVVDKPIAIRLNAGETLGPPIVLHYRYWEATFVYEVQRRCPPPPPSAKSA